MIVRAPTPGDIDRLVDLGAELHRESSYAFLPYDREKVRALVVQYIDDTATRCGLVAEADGDVIGMIGGTVVDYYFCDETLVADEILFVTPGWRGSLAAARLIRALQAWAVARGARELCLSISTGVRADATGRFYERLGFTRVGGVFKKRLAAG